MASVSFFLRSKVEDRESTIWLKFRDKKVDIRIPLENLTCKKSEWKVGKCKSSSKKMHVLDDETINIKLSKIEAKIISAFDNSKPEFDVKDWLKGLVYSDNETISDSTVTDEVISFCDVYYANKKSTVTTATLKKINVIKNLLIRYVDSRKEPNRNFTKLRFSDLDNKFKEDFIKYSEEEQYQYSTIYRNLKFLKMIAKIAESFGIEVSRHINTWHLPLKKATRDNPKSIYLTFDDLKKIEEKEMPNDYLDNARDWLVISCYTGQRVSDYLRFKSSMIVEDQAGKKYIQFTQKKTNTAIRLPILKKVQEILEKRDGEFPRSISAVNLNLFIKEVCKIAELNEKVYNGKVMKITKEDGSSITRKVYGEYAKHELVTSHIGRKSFASNFYENIPTAYLLNFTGHTTERQFLDYINKTDVEKARSTAEIFDRLGY